LKNSDSDLSFNNENRGFLVTYRHKAQGANGLKRCALDNENEDDDEYEEECCIISYSYSCSSSSSITASLR
jgi:hypothetical protein